MITVKHHLTTFDSRAETIAALKEFAPYMEQMTTWAEHAWLEVCSLRGTTLWSIVLARCSKQLTFENDIDIVHMLTRAFLEKAARSSSVAEQRDGMLHALCCVQAFTMLPYKQGLPIMKQLGYEPKNERGHSARWVKGVVADALGESHRQPCERWKTDDCPPGIVEGDCDRCPRIYI
jgi:hypothetical protein